MQTSKCGSEIGQYVLFLSTSLRLRTLSSPRRFPPPWSVEDIGAAFVVTDSAGQKLACVYFDDPRAAAKPLTRDEARRIAVNVDKLPGLTRQVTVAPVSQFGSRNQAAG